MSWKWPNIGSRMSREVHVRFWESAEVRSLRATRQLPTFWPMLRYDRFTSHSGPSYEASGYLRKKSMYVSCKLPPSSSHLATAQVRTVSSVKNEICGWKSSKSRLRWLLNSNRLPITSPAIAPIIGSNASLQWSLVEVPYHYAEFHF